MDVVCSGNCQIDRNLIQAGITIIGKGKQNNQITGNQVNMFSTVRDSASDTLSIRITV